jgi:hypothetical protein
MVTDLKSISSQYKVKPINPRMHGQTVYALTSKNVALPGVNLGCFLILLTESALQ